MRTAKYDKKIKVQKNTEVETEIKGFKTSWADFYTSWASIEPISGAKAVDFTRMGFIESYELEMRKRETNVDSDCRIQYDGKNFQITSIKIHDDVKLDIARK